MSYKIKDEVAILTFNNKNEKINSLNEQVTNEASAIMRELNSNSNIKAGVIISGKTDNFIVGADIAMLSRLKSVPEAEAMVKGKLSTDATIALFTLTRHE